MSMATTLAWLNTNNGLWTFDVEALAALTRLGKLFDVINTLDHHLPTMPYTRIDMVELQRT